MDEELSDIWTLYFHDPYDVNWTYSSYVRICDISTLPYFDSLSKFINKRITLGMFFLFRESIFPCWDDPSNINGGTLSFKISKDNAMDFFYNICSKVLLDDIIDVEKTNTISYDFDTICGLSISPKKNDCIIKIWLKSTEINSIEYFKNSFDYTGEVIFQLNKQKIVDTQ